MASPSRDDDAGSIDFSAATHPRSAQFKLLALTAAWLYSSREIGLPRTQSSRRDVFLVFFGVPFERAPALFRLGLCFRRIACLWRKAGAASVECGATRSPAALAASHRFGDQLVGSDSLHRDVFHHQHHSASSSARASSDAVARSRLDAVEHAAERLRP